MNVSVAVPPMVDTLRRVRRCTSGTRLWTCDAGRARKRIRSEALHQRLPSDVLPRIARERVPTAPPAALHLRLPSDVLPLIARQRVPAAPPAPNAKRRTPNAKRRTPNAKRRTPNAERGTRKAEGGPWTTDHEKRQTESGP